MNKTQKKYAVAKALKESIQQTIEDAEKSLIKDLGITNADECSPALIYMIDDKEDFDKACNEFERLHGDLNDALNAASDALRTAEDALIEQGLRIAPSEVRRVLERHKNDPRFRGKLIDLAFRLDFRTVPKGINYHD